MSFTEKFSRKDWIEFLRVLRMCQNIEIEKYILEMCKINKIPYRLI